MTGTEKAASAPAAKSGKLQVTDEKGIELGFTIDLGGGGGEGDDNAALAKRVRGWSEMYVDGQKYPHSEHNALALLNRFPHIAEQVRRGEPLKPPESKT